MDISILKEVGLTDNEIKVYMVLLKTDSALASEIAIKTNINRTNTYDVLESLVEKGIVSYVIKANRKYFMATDPNRLLAYLKERESKLREQEKEIEKLIPSLLSMKAKTKEKIKVEIYRGKEGLKTIFEDILKEKKEYWALGYTGFASNVLPYYFYHWHKRRVKTGIKRRLIAGPERRGTKPIKLPLTKVKYLPKHYHSPTSTMIYGDKIWIFLPIGTEHVSVLIENKEINESYRSYFEVLWKIAER